MCKSPAWSKIMVLQNMEFRGIVEGSSVLGFVVCSHQALKCSEGKVFPKKLRSMRQSLVYGKVQVLQKVADVGLPVDSKICPFLGVVKRWKGL